jgi:hypothetical protein
MYKSVDAIEVGVWGKKVGAVALDPNLHYYSNLDHLESPEYLAYSLRMRSIKEIEEELSQLNPDDRRRIANWLAEFEADLWDQQIAKDAADGKLDRFVNEAIEEYHEQKTRPLP